MSDAVVGHYRVVDNRFEHSINHRNIHFIDYSKSNVKLNSGLNSKSNEITAIITDYNIPEAHR